MFFVSPADEKLPPKILVVDAESEHKDKMVEVELTRFPSDSHGPAGKIVSVIGFIDDPNVETNVIIRKYGLPVEFPEAVIGETASLQDELREEDFANRDDFRDRSIVTIDPATARGTLMTLSMSRKPPGEGFASASTSPTCLTSFPSTPRPIAKVGFAAPPSIFRIASFRCFPRKSPTSSALSTHMLTA